MQPFFQIFVDFTWNDPNENKSKQILTCVCLNGSSQLNKPYFYMEIVRFESQEYALQDKLWI